MTLHLEVSYDAGWWVIRAVDGPDRVILGRERLERDAAQAARMVGRSLCIPVHTITEEPMA